MEEFETNVKKLLLSFMEQRHGRNGCEVGAKDNGPFL